jgi:hypothetical protein
VREREDAREKERKRERKEGRRFFDIFEEREREGKRPSTFLLCSFCSR